MPNLNIKGYNNKVDNFDKKTKDLIYDLRINKNWSYPEIACKLNMSHTTIFKYVKKYLSPTFNPELVSPQQKAMLGNDFNQKYSPDDIKTLLDDLYNFALNSPNIMIERFLFAKYGKTEDWLSNLTCAYPFLREELLKIRRLIAKKIHDYSINNKYNVNYAKDILPLFDNDYKELKKEQANWGKQEEQKESTLNVFVKDYSKEDKEEPKE